MGNKSRNHRAQWNETLKNLGFPNDGVVSHRKLAQNIFDLTIGHQHSQCVLTAR